MLDKLEKEMTDFEKKYDVKSPRLHHFVSDLKRSLQPNAQNYFIKKMQKKSHNKIINMVFSGLRMAYKLEDRQLIEKIKKCIKIIDKNDLFDGSIKVLEWEIGLSPSIKAFASSIANSGLKNEEW